ncbi:MAG TPA: LysM peptidoglycan-binding domain-containing protein, partial [Calditrichae bacterium]|nr:LysM peptidoglycan-binding domain-containing protein [Calditrichia bacterium]
MLLDSLNAKIDEGDTTGFAALYESALVTLDSLQLSGSMSPGIYPYYRSHLDSLWEEYQSFTHAQKDSSEIADVFHRIDQIADSLEEADTTEVLIPDIINQHHMMRIPLVLNRQVESAIKYFTTTRRGRRVFSVWLKRAGRYEKLIRSILREEGVPEELFYLAMIESGLNPNARSYARAVGIWQFIGSTGRAYGLRYSWWYDERRDPVKSTRAAARHLKDLYDRFGDWYLALAGYNFSPRKIEYRLRRYKVSRYWDLPRLPRQTRNYVPTFIAAAIIAKNPEKYGFNVTPDPPLEFDTVMVRETVDLNIVAQCVSSTFSTIKELNPELLRWCTPPDRKEWVLKIPKGTREQFLTEYAKIPDNKKFTYIRHRIRFGETLSTIARRYGVSMSVIKRFNKLRGTRIRAGSSLIIPVPQNRDYYRYVRKNSTRRRTRKIVKNVPGRKKVVYTVKPGDTLWDIAQ